jgi:site-specific DNA recombinase
MIMRATVGRNAPWRTSWPTWSVPGVDAAMEAGNLLENLPALWQEADLTERRKLLMAMLDAVYVDTDEEKSVVAIRPKPAFRPIFEVATTREGSGIALINQTPQAHLESGASESCSWWRRGRVELPQERGIEVAVAVA